MKKQVLVIHGAGAFYSLDRADFIESLKKHPVDLNWFRSGGGSWKAHLEERLGGVYEVLAPKMPDPDNPQYESWKIWFEKILPELSNELILVGHSLGGAFLAKYLAAEKIDKNVLGVFLVAAPYLETESDRGFELPADISLIHQAQKVFLYFSKDDVIVKFENCQKFENALPQATFQKLEGRGHFNTDDFPEIIQDIQSV